MKRYKGSIIMNMGTPTAPSVVVTGVAQGVHGEGLTWDVLNTLL